MSQEEMVPCEHVVAKLWEYLDGTLDELRSEQVREHLEVCEKCFPEYDFRRAYLRFMGRCATEQVRPELRQQIFEMLLEEERKAELARVDPEGGLLQRTGATLRRILKRS
jgi:anti-sigma factor (TIGR02949 family)